MENENQIKNLISLCDDLTTTKMLFADQKINKILEAIAECPEVYELISECMNSFNKAKEFDRSFTKDSTGKKIFVMPKEEYKVLALVFCLLADIGSGKIKYDELITSYFADENNRLDSQKFMESVILPFKNLLIDAFGLQEPESETVEEEAEPMTEEQIEALPPEERLKIVPFPIERSSYYLKDPTGACLTFIAAKDAAIEMIERLCEEKETAQTDDVNLMLHCVIIACLEQDFDLVNGLVCGLKYATKGIRSLKYLMRELESIVQTQIKHETK